MDKARTSGASDETIERTRRQLAEFKTMDDNPLTNAAITFIEPFPVGVLMTLVSAAVLRRKPPV